MPGICPRCKRMVYAAEERLALSGSSWHQECFTCAICNKSLDSTTMTENRENQEIYCKNCYRIHFAIQGYGYGPNKPTLVANSPPLEDCYDVTPTNSKTSLYQARSRPKPPVVDSNFIPPPSWKGLQYWTKHPRVKHYGNQVITSTRQLKKCDSIESMRSTIPPSAIVKSTPRPEPRTYDANFINNSYTNTATTLMYSRPMTVPLNMHPGSYTNNAYANQRFPSPSKSLSSHYGSSSRARSPGGRIGGNVDICAKCGKPVYFAERKFGYHGVYHPKCFVCTSCGKSLDATTVSENAGQLFCKGCYKRYIATEGVGYGLGAGTLQTH